MPEKMKMEWSQICLNCLYGAAGLAGVAVGLLYFLQEKLIYVPRLPGIPSHYPYFPNDFDMAFEDVWLTAADGVKLHAWMMWPRHWGPEQRRKRPTVLFFQENAGNMAFRLPYIRIFLRMVDCSVLILSYRGYGQSEGRPNERGLQMDGQAALDHLVGREDIDTSKLFLLGKSLGGGVAFYIAQQNKDKVKGLIIENTFTSLTDTVGVVMPVLSPLVGPGKPANFLVRNKWPNSAYIQSLQDMPILFLCSVQDEMLGAQQMRDLYGVHPSPPWEWVEFEDARHMDAYEVAAAQYWPAVAGFVQRLVEA